MNISVFHKCANCGACSNLCPHGAITVDGNGMFYKPVVDKTKCIDCGLCTVRCPVNTDSVSYTPIQAYAGWHNSEQVVLESSSGGVFHGLAQYVIGNGGIVFGAAYASGFKEVQFVSSDECDLLKLKKSKYVESLTGTAFIQIKEALAKGRIVLFCGTPCQVAGLYAFLGNRPDRLITCDFVCGGLPSHKIYQEYVKNLEKKYGAELSSIDFRPKTHGWRRYAVWAKFKNGRIYNRLGTEDPYLRSFLYGKYTVRDECLECKFSEHHVSDITIADFWLNAKFVEVNNRNGVSLVICNTSFGKRVVESIKDQYILWELPIEEALYNHKKTEVSCEYRQRHEAFIRLCSEKGLDAACHTYLPISFKNRCKNRFCRLLCKSRRRKG